MNDLSLNIELYNELLQMFNNDAKAALEYLKSSKLRREKAIAA